MRVRATAIVGMLLGFTSTPAQIRPELSPARIIVHTAPGAKVYLDGRLAGMSDGQGLITLNRKAGVYALKVALDGKQEYSRSITLTPGEIRRINADLKELTGGLDLFTTPNGNVSVDGKPAGAADASGVIRLRNLTQGARSVRISLDGYEVKEGSVQIVPDETITLSMELIRIVNPYKPPPGVTVPRFIYARSLGGFETDDAFVSNVTFSPDGRWLAAVGIKDGESGRRIRIWDTASGRPISKRLVPGGYKVLALTFSPDGAWLASWFADSEGNEAWQRGIVLISDIATDKEVYRISLADVNKQYNVENPSLSFPDLDSLAFSPDCKQFIASRVFGAVIWDVGNWQILRSMRSPGIGQAIFSRDGRWLATANEELKILDRKADWKERVVARRKGHDFGWAAFSADGRWIAARQDWDLYFWDTATGEELAPLRGTEGSFAWASFGPERRWLAELQMAEVRHQDGRGRELLQQVNIWDLMTRQIVQTLEPKFNSQPHVSAHKSVALSPDGSWLATAAYPIRNSVGVRIWQAQKKSSR